jgi:alkylhydroperoxidase family enzyme
MILYTIAKSNNCMYCSATNELACRTLGVDEAALETLVEDLPSFTPQRVRVIIEFALKIAHDRQNLVAEDYDKVRAQGISDAELVEIVLVAAVGVFNDTVADALMIDVDSEVVAALGS